MAFFKAFLRNHPALIFLLPFSAFLIFIGLADSVLQVDEGGDTFVSTTILKYGIPRHSDGLNSTMPYADIYDGLFVYRTWLPYYVQALSMSVFGQNTWAARLPFAFCGILSVFCLYFFTLKYTGRKSAAFIASLLLACSVPALLYFRTARYVGMPILLTIFLLFYYLKIFERKKWNPVPLTVTAVLFFHTMYVEFAGIIAGLLIHFFIHRREIRTENYKSAAGSAGITALLCLPWLFLVYPVFPHIAQFYTSTSSLIDNSALGFPKHFFGFLFQINNYIFPFVLLPFLLLQSLNRHRRLIRLLVICILSLLVIASAHSIPLQQYIAAGFPMFYLLLALIITECIGGRLWVQSVLICVLISTNLLHVGPLMPIKGFLRMQLDLFQNSPYLQYAQRTFTREIRLSSIFYRHWYQLAHPYKGPLDGLVEFFKLHGKSGETCYIDNEPEALAFYSGMQMIQNHELTWNHTPDWIVLRGDRRFLESDDSPSPVAAKLQHILGSNPYRKIELDVPVRRVNNSYDTQIHLFRSPPLTDKTLVFRLQPTTEMKLP